MAKRAYSITKVGDVSIHLAKKNIALAKDSWVKVEEMPKSQLPEFLKARIGKGKLTASEVAKRGGIAVSYVSELLSGQKDPLSMTGDAILRLAKGLDESPVLVWRAIIGKLKPALKGEALSQILEDYERLEPRAQADLEFVVQQLRKMVSDKSTSNP